jgi:ATP-binding cassette subfamily C (CFTR/MRP) protein 10
MKLYCMQCLWVNTANRSGFSEGEIQTFMSVDADRIVNLCNSLHDLWR